MAKKPIKHSFQRQRHKRKRSLISAQQKLQTTRNNQRQRTRWQPSKKLQENNINRQHSVNLRTSPTTLYTNKQFVTILNTGIGLIFACFIGGVLWIFNAPKELVWGIFLITGMFGLVYFIPLPKQYRNCAYAALTVGAGTFLIKVLSFSHQAVIDLTKNPVLEFIEKLVKLIFH